MLKCLYIYRITDLDQNVKMFLHFEACNDGTECVFSAGELIQGQDGPLLREMEPLKTEGFLYNPELCYAVYADRQFGAAAVLNRKVMEGVESFLGRKFFLFPLNTERMVLIHEEDHRLMEKTLVYLGERQEEGVDVENDLSNSMYVWEEGKLSPLGQKED